jgi:PPK2 family polyphosphate:nucleotide phosphotransferase
MAKDREKKKSTDRGGLAGPDAAKSAELAVPAAARASVPLREALRFRSGAQLVDFSPDATPGYPGDGKGDAPDLTAGLAPALSAWQERLFADGKAEPARAQRLLVVLQGLDTSGKGGVARHVFGLVDPQGLKLASFKQPTKEELSHNFLWRIRRQLPGPGLIGVFDRSHYEDVLVVRVNGLVPPEVWERRYDEINRFEAGLAEAGTTVVKCFLNISTDEQRARLLARLTDQTKWWKYSPNDLPVRERWDDYMVAYQDALTRCSKGAPWYVIPANRKWYRNWAVATLLLEHLEAMAPQWPPANFDVAAEAARVAAS